MRKTSIIILTYNQLSYTVQCVESIRAHTKEFDYEIIIVDNASTDGTRDWLLQQGDVYVIQNEENLGFPHGCNQGIEVATGDSIVLLNNDVIVTPNWLRNLLTALYSEECIGAVGPLTNSASYYSTISVAYESLDYMIEFARKYNHISDPAKWEERLKLIGFCLVMKRAVIKEIGLLDERFSPGNYEDDDLCLRMRMAGYKLYLCRDTFVHHFGSTSWKEDSHHYTELLRTNEQKYINKWGINSQQLVIHTEMIELITSLQKSFYHILHVGCQAGGTLLSLKRHYPRAVMTGLDANYNTVHIAKHYLHVIQGDLHAEQLVQQKQVYDLIIITDFGSMRDLHEIVRAAKRLLCDFGILLLQVRNASYYEVIRGLLQGSNPFYQGEPLYTLQDCQLAMNTHGFKVLSQSGHITASEEREELIGNLCKIGPAERRAHYEISHYFICAIALDKQLILLIEHLLQGQHLAHVLVQMRQYSCDTIVRTVKEGYAAAQQVLQYIAAHYFEWGYAVDALFLLEAANEIERGNRDILYSISFIFTKQQELEKARLYMEQIPIKAEREWALYQEIDRKQREKQELILLLRRLECRLHAPEDTELLQELLQVYNREQVLQVMQRHSMNPLQATAELAKQLYANGKQNESLYYMRSIPAAQMTKEIEQLKLLMEEGGDA